MRAEINKTLKRLMAENDKILLIGESICDPYGGVAKVTRGISTRFPDRVIDMPISEAAMIGFSLGLAMQGFIPIVEIMFFDFITLCTDQLFNIGRKLDEVHNIDFKMIIRTMVGLDTYGPTHSQDLRKLLDAIGIPHFTCGQDVEMLYSAILNSQNKITVIIEQKKLY